MRLPSGAGDGRNPAVSSAGRRGLIAAALVLGLAGAPAHAQRQAAGKTETFAAQVLRLSEPGGYFDSDNLISNETSYLHVMDALDRLGVRGGAFIGVGPDQSFSYVAAVRPRVAYIIDIRRDNMLMHLMFKALFAESATRVEYLSLWFGRPAPPRPAAWASAPIQRIIHWVDSVPATEASSRAAMQRVRSRVERFGLPLSSQDLETLDRFHRAFIAEGLDIQFTSRGRFSRRAYPTYRDLLLERDRSGRPRNYLDRDADYRFLRELQSRDRVIPVVGDLAGPHALAAIGREIAAQRLAVSVLYVSNVEQYLFRSDVFDRFARTVGTLPRNARSVIVRSWFSGYPQRHPFNVTGHRSTQIAQTFEAFLRGLALGYGSYWDVATHDPIPPG